MDRKIARLFYCPVAALNIVSKKTPVSAFKLYIVDQVVSMDVAFIGNIRSAQATTTCNEFSAQRIHCKSLDRITKITRKKQQHKHMP